MLVLLAVSLFLASPASAHADVCGPGSSAASCAITPTGFTDVPPEHEFAAPIARLRERGILAGYPDGTFRPLRTVNRAEFVKIVIGATTEAPSVQACLEDTPDSVLMFSDVPAGSWYEPFVCFAKFSNVVAGYPDGTFRPSATISTAEAAKILALQYEQYGLTVPAAHPPEAWWERYVAALRDIDALPPDYHSPAKPVTRAELAYMVDAVTRAVHDPSWQQPRSRAE